MKLRELDSIDGGPVPSRQVIELRYQLGPPPEHDQSEMASAFGVAQSTWSSWESNGIPKGAAAKLFRWFRSQSLATRKE